MTTAVMFRSRAPLRISFCGGGTDVKPYPEEQGGCVLSTTINMYAYVTIIPRSDQEVHVTSLDYDTVAQYHTGELVYDGKLDLVKAALKSLGIKQGLNFFLHTDAPPGSGLGSSSAMVVAVVGALGKWQNLPLTPYDVADIAYRVEREELQIVGGMQDQYAATFGGFNYIEFLRDSVVVNPLRISSDHLNELWYHLLLCDTGIRRLSSQIVSKQRESYIQGRKGVVAALDEIKDLTIRMKNSLLRGRFLEFAHLLHEAWESKKHLHRQISSERIDRLYEVARRNGAIGGKLLGAGGGGYLIFYCSFDKKHLVAKELEKAGGKVANFHFESAGLQTWRAPR